VETRGIVGRNAFEQRTQVGALAFLSKLFTWHASRSDQFRSPIVRGIGRVKPRERAGKRVLNDEEIRDVWAALDAGIENVPACFADLVKTLLLPASD
jgi:hypothetical protein